MNESEGWAKEASDIEDLPVLRALQLAGVKYRTFTHGPVYTCIEAAKARGIPLKQELKSLFVNYSKDRFALLNLRGDQRINRKLARSALNTRSFRLANREELRRFDTSLGLISPLSMSNCRLLLDPSVLRMQYVVTNAGSLNIAVRIAVDDLVNLYEFEIVPLTER